MSYVIAWQVTKASSLLSEGHSKKKKKGQKRFIYVKNSCLCRAQTEFVLSSASHFPCSQLFSKDYILLGFIGNDFNLY